MMQSPIYLDYNATTPCRPEVVNEMIPYFINDFGNASSSHHAYGWLAKDAIDEATHKIAKLLSISAKEIVYTSGATESINSILKRVLLNSSNKKKQIITAKTEHKAVLDVCSFLSTNECEILYVNTLKNGLIDLDHLEDLISKECALVSIMYANNETGVIQPIQSISRICKAYNIPLFSDATQALGKIDVIEFLKFVDFACFSGHKIYGPKGIGFTYYNKQITNTIGPWIHGGGQQRGMRGGTYNSPGIVGLAKAIELSLFDLKEESKRISLLRNKLEEGLSNIEQISIQGKSVDRLPNTINISFDYVDGEQLLRALSRHIAVSNGSACNSETVLPSHVLIEMGVSESLAFSTLRFSLGRDTTMDDIQQTIKVVKQEIETQRASNILWERR